MAHSTKDEWKKLGPTKQKALVLIEANPGITTAELAICLNVIDEQNGLQKAASWAVVNLRKKGLIDDVAERCTHCGSALSRGTPNQPLNVSEQGLYMLEVVGTAEQSRAMNQDLNIQEVVHG